MSPSQILIYWSAPFILALLSWLIILFFTFLPNYLLKKFDNWKKSLGALFVIIALIGFVVGLVLTIYYYVEGCSDMGCFFIFVPFIVCGVTAAVFVVQTVILFILKKINVENKKLFKILLIVPILVFVSVLVYFLYFELRDYKLTKAVMSGKVENCQKIDNQYSQKRCLSELVAFKKIADYNCKNQENTVQCVSSFCEHFFGYHNGAPFNNCAKALLPRN